MNAGNKKSILFIVNPFSGTSGKGSLENSILKHLDLNKFDYQIQYTEASGHAISLSKAAANKKDIVVAVGGDGTVNEVASQLLHSKTSLGIIPGGSGNGFSMHLGIGRNLVRAINILNNGISKKVDTCTMNNHFFNNVAGLGFDAKIAFLTKKNKLRGFLNYFISSIREAFRYKPEHLRIDINGEIVEGHFAAAVVANASMYGYYFTIAPTAALDDGLLDVMLIKAAPLYRYLFLLPRFLNRSLHKSSLSKTYQGSKILIKAYRPCHAHIDGEGLDLASEYEFSILPKSLSVITPAIKTKV